MARPFFHLRQPRLVKSHHLARSQRHSKRRLQTYQDTAIMGLLANILTVLDEHCKDCTVAAATVSEV
jgi:hypothetical protein